MRTLKIIFILLALIPITSFSHAIIKPQLIFKVSSETFILDNTNIKDAQLEKEKDGTYALSLTISATAAKQLSKLCNDNIRKTLYLYFGKDQLISRSIIQSTLGEKLLILHFPEKEANELINSLQKNH